jgi:serine/threonine protein kinase
MKIEFDDLDLGESLGTGTVGDVFRAKIKSTGDLVAVKFLQKAVSADELVRARFRREIAILERLRHPHIIHYFGDGERDGQLFYAMEILDGGNVSDLLQRYDRLNWAEVASIARQVCSALQHAHNFGIIHRDLKPSNLFLTLEASVKLGDFGIARDTNSADLTNQGLTVGTNSYMSPEQIRGDDNLTGKADLYSLGCVLFEMLTGHKPYEGRNFASLFEQHLFKDPPRVEEHVPDVPQPICDIVLQLLQKDPNDRPFNARTVQGVMIGALDSPEQHATLGERDQISSAADDVGAGSVVDPGLKLLQSKLSPDPQRNVSWMFLGVISVIALALVLVAAFSAQ